jgi:hypothetical protein
MVCVTVQDSDGLHEGTALYRYSTDGGSSWSGWLADGSLAHSSPEVTTVYLTLTISSLIESASANQVRFSLLDFSGANEESGPYTVQVDGTPPDVTATPDKTGSWIQPPVNIALQANDALSGVDRTEYRRQGAMTWRTGAVIIIDGSQGDGTYTYEYRARDRAGNVSDPQTVSVNVDGTAPEQPTNLFTTPPGWTNVNSFGLTWANPADPSGIAGVYYQLDTDPNLGGSPIGPILGDNISSLADITVPSEGQHTIYIWLLDGAGNSDSHNRAVLTNAFKYDTTPPTTTPSYTPPLPAGEWFSGTVTVQLNGADSASGVQETRWRRAGDLWNTGNSFSVSATNNYEYMSVDWAGNPEAVKTLTVQIDNVPPASSIAVTPSVPPSGWYNGTVTVTISAVDSTPGSGWAGDSYYQVDSGPWQYGSVAIISASGTHAFTYYAVDVAGNAESPKTISNVCRIDRDAPIVTAIPNKTGACAQPPVAVTLVATDTLSGVAAVQYRRLGTSSWITGTLITVSGADGAYTYEYRARDIAGNESSIQTVTVTIDGTPPGRPTGLAATPSGWTNVNSFRLCWTNPSDQCGIAGVYYQLDVDPTSGGTPVGPITGTGISCLPAISVPSQGQHTVYVWLMDGAGNSDRYSRQVLNDALKYDATPPYCDATVVGPVGEDPLWFTGCVTVTLNANDATSGVAAISYQIEGESAITIPVAGAPTSARQPVSLCYECGRKSVSYWARDVAGNVQATPGSVTVRIDRQAPGAPMSATVSPSGWVSANNFSISWTNPSECSGVVSVFYKKGNPPTTSNDGQAYTLPLGAPPRIPGITVDREGQTLVYVWLKDRAGNTDYRTAISVPLRYDITPPTTRLNPSGTMGRNSYYVSTVTLRFEASDSASGVVETRYRINDGAWQTWKGASVTFSNEGTYTVEYYSVDIAGNRELTQRAVLKLDLYAPTATLHVEPDYLGRSFEGANVCWSGVDTRSGSGVEKYTVQYRKNACGDWQDWLSDTASPCATRTGMTANWFHYFRVRAEDRAGHVSAWSPSGEDLVYVEGLINPSFDTCDWPLWVPAPDDVGKLTARVVETTTHTLGSSCMARLSKEWPTNGVPIDAFTKFYQLIQLPAMECGRNQGLMLSFWYHILTYDKAWGKVSDNGTPDDRTDDIYGWLDTFEVHILDRDGRELAEVLRDGYFGDHDPGTLYNLGWRYYAVNLAPWAGQQVRIEFRVWNRVDKWYPTWVYVDDVKLLPSLTHNHTVYLPVTYRNRAGGAHAALPSPATGRLIPPDGSAYNRGDRPPRR